jgi:hypothetical protein
MAEAATTGIQEQTMKWITWQQQTDLARLIRYYIDKGAAVEPLQIILGDPQERYTESEIREEIKRLTDLWLIVDNDDFLQVTEWSRDALWQAVPAAEEWVDILRFLLDRGVWHPDMVQHELVTKEGAPNVYRLLSEKEVGK